MILEVTKQKLRVKGEVTEGAINYATFELHCDKSWEDFVKTVRFATEDGIYDISDVETCRAYYIPHEVLLEGKVWVGVVGVSGENRVATTEKASFYVKGAIASGGTPTATPNAYAKFVNDVKACESSVEASEKSTLEALGKCREILEEVRSLTDKVTESSERSMNIRDEVYGMMNAVGMAFRGIREIEERVSATDSKYSSEEKRRDRGEQIRAFGESKRVASEEERGQRELERESAESRRNTAEQVRAMSDVRRNRRLAELESRLDALENTAPVPLTHICFTVSDESEIAVDDCTEIKSITLYGNTQLDGNGLHGVAEDGFVRFSVDGDESELFVTAPLYSTGDVADSVTVTADGCVTVCRRTEKITLTGTESFVVDKGNDGSTMLVTPLIGERPLYDGFVTTASLPDGCKEAFISGDYLFFYVDSDIPTFTEALKNRPAELIYPTLAQHEDSEGSTEPLSPKKHIRYDGKISAECHKDLFEALNLLNEKIEGLKEKKQNEDT